MTGQPLSVHESTSPVGIGRIAGYVPSNSVDMAEAAAHFGVSAEFIESKTGFLSLSRRGPDEDTSDLAIAAVRRLELMEPGVIERARLLIVVTQNPDGFGLPHVSAKIASALNMRKDLAAFDIGLGCSGWVYGAATALALMEAQGIDDGLLVTADPYSKIVSPSDKNTAMLFGDAATATALTRWNPVWRFGRAVFGTDGDKADALEVRADRRLGMNGRGVFEFSATRVPEAIRDALERNGIGWQDVDRVILHQGSRYIVETIAKRINQMDKTPFGATHYGNAVSSSIPLMLEAEADLGYRCVLTAGFGVGLSWAVAPLFLLGD